MEQKSNQPSWAIWELFSLIIRALSCFSTTAFSVSLFLQIIKSTTQSRNYGKVKKTFLWQLWQLAREETIKRNILFLSSRRCIVGSYFLVFLWLRAAIRAILTNKLWKEVKCVTFRMKAAEVNSCRALFFFNYWN